ncbi:MAG: addiction module protein [Burkholderiaceae bacterium]
MNARTDQLLLELLSLPADERAEVAVALLDSLEGDDSSAISAAWREEIRHRKADITSGKMKMVPWGEAKARILAL